ncbi:hypothetical protein QFZ81_007117 [Paenibacillus sp. V4I9]|nr:hypothetical protein [Paenibacillus sp. V4I9]
MYAISLISLKTKEIEAFRDPYSEDWFCKTSTFGL